MAYLAANFGRLPTLVLKRPATAILTTTAKPAPAPTATPAPTPTATSGSGLDAALAQCAKLGPPAYYLRKLCEDAARKKYAAAPGGTAAPVPTTPTKPKQEPTVMPDTGGVSLEHPETPAPTPTPSVAPAIAPPAPPPTTSTVAGDVGGVSLGGEAPAPSSPRAAPAPMPSTAAPAGGEAPSEAGGIPAWAYVAGGLGLTLLVVALIAAARRRG